MFLIQWFILQPVFCKNRTKVVIRNVKSVLSFYEMFSFLINTPTLKWYNSCIFMEIAFKVVEDANFFCFFNRAIAAAGWITSQFGHWRKRYHSKVREQIVIKDFSRKESSSEVVGWSKRLRWIIGPVVSKLFIIFVLGAILESLFTQS